MRLNIQKCKVMHIGKTNKNAVYEMQDSVTSSRQRISTSECERDLGISITNDLKPSVQVSKASAKANRLLGLFKNCLTTRDLTTWSLVYKTYIRPHLEFAISAWSPYRAKDIKALEKVQHRATKIAQGLRDMAYENRCKIMGLTSLSERRVRGDMIQQFKIKHSFEIINWYSTPSYSDPRGGHRGHLRREIIRACDQRHFFFNNRIANIWNSLPDNIINSTSVNSFKKKLDDYWSTAIGRHLLMTRSACI